MATITDILNHNDCVSDAALASVTTWLASQGFVVGENLLPCLCEVCGAGSEALQNGEAITAYHVADLGNRETLVVGLYPTTGLVSLRYDAHLCAGETTLFGTWAAYNAMSLDDHCTCTWGA